MAFTFNPFTGNFDAINDPQAVVAVTTSTHTAAANTVVLCAYAGALAITLPTPVANSQLIIKDVTGAAESNTITITPSSGNIDGNGSQTITSNYGSVALVADGTNWWIL